MPPRRDRYHLIDLMMVVLLSGLVFASARWAWMIITLERGLPAPGNEPRTTISSTSFVALELAFIAWFIAWKAIRGRRNAPECAECGRRFLPPKRSNGPAACPRCRRRALPPSELKKERAKGLWTILVLLAILSPFMGFVLSDLVAARFGRSYWLALPLLATGATLGLFAALLIPFILLALIRNRMMVGEKYTLAHARRVSGEEGDEVSPGPIKLWYSGPTDPAPMLLEQMEAVRGRFAGMVGEAIEVRGPLHIFCFARRDALVAYHRQAPTDLWNYDGLYNPAPARRATLTTEIIRHRPCDTEATARSLLALALLEQCPRPVAPGGYHPCPDLRRRPRPIES